MKHAKESNIPLNSAEVGLVLLDLSLNLIAFDRGAASILNDVAQPQPASPGTVTVPQDILEAVRRLSPSDLSSVKTQFRMGRRDYSCRAYLMEALDGSSNSLIALHLERDSSVADVIYRVAEEYHLTDREREALSGISMGLSSKQLAERMHISPNTVKAFRRLIMIKMGVTSRAGVVAKLLEHNGYTSTPLRQPLAS